MSCHVMSAHATPRHASGGGSRVSLALGARMPILMHRVPVARLVPLLPIILLQRRTHTHFAHADRSAFFIGALFASLERKRNAHAQGYLIRIAASIHRPPFALTHARTLVKIYGYRPHLLVRTYIHT